ncbi:MFS general substrate transporter [Apiospora phragmitis]|uniref:MFS general substrate transporter n=1 Tax=Apiospora phragmitis TaxID=2905665 RepID=A0ABR1VJG5_9PEZI
MKIQRVEDDFQVCTPDLEKTVPESTDTFPESVEDGPGKTSVDDVGESSSSSNDETGVQHLNRLQFATLSLAMALSVFLMALDESIIATAIPRITDDFRSLNDVGWYGSGYMMTMACFQLTFGKLYKHLSSKWVLLSSLLVFEVGSAVSGSAPSSAALIAGRVVAGIGASGIVSGVLIVVSQVVPLRQRAIYTSSVGSIYGVAAVCGPFRLTWRWCFYINLPLGAAAALATLLLYHPPPTTDTSKDDENRRLRSAADWALMLDPLGLSLFTGAIICLFFALHVSGFLGWAAPAPIALLVAFGLLLLAFAAVQAWLGERGTLPPRIARMRRVVCASLYAFLLDSVYYVVAYFLPIWFQAVAGVRARDSGIRLIPIIAAAVLCSLVSGVVVAKTGHYAPAVFLSALVSAAGAGLLSTITPSSGSGEWIGYQTLVGVGVGLGMQQGAVVVQIGLGPGDIPTAIAAVTLFQALGSAVMLSVTQNVFASRVYAQLHEADGRLTREMITNTGATEIINLAPPGQHDVFRDAFSLAISQCFYVAVAAGALSALFGFGLGFQEDAALKLYGFYQRILRTGLPP